mmetsp:Transcript_7310/g.13882  ORF Transcript_7310/g.13882 Transcript_7310/m.13882 type:complete len:258 (-) Transcript_7310:295-1068(-)
MKCLRKRHTENMKIDSVKRKFYRWFPDLEERFVKDKAGFYRPKFGHQFEMCYRQAMRAKDGETLSKKRTKCRLQRFGFVEEVDVESSTNAERSTFAYATTTDSTDCIPVSAMSAEASSVLAYNTASSLTDYTSISPVPPPAAVSPSPSFYNQEQLGVKDTDVKLDYDHDLTASESIIADSEPMDNHFTAELGIFDDVERSFFGSDPSAEQYPSSTSLESDPLRIDGDMLDKSMEDYCEEILASGAESKAPDFHFDTI